MNKEKLKNVEYRSAKKEDVNDILPLMSELGYEHSLPSLSENLQGISQSGGVVIVAEYEGKLVGCICVILAYRLAEGLCGECVSVVVSSEYRGLGIGKQLIEKAEDWLKQKVDRVVIRANVIRKAAHVFYENLGYSSTKSQKVFHKVL